MKLYVIGNGFDLAHGLKTSYRDYYAFVKENANIINGWGIILEYFHEDHEFWSDAETNICKIDRKRFLEPKKLVGFSDLDILLSKIRDSFGRFIINEEASINGLNPVFELDKESLFLTFNYTSVLESVYNIPDDRVIHLHNTAVGSFKNRYLHFIDADEIVLGHGPDFKHFFFWADQEIGSDKDYISFRVKTLKNTSEIIRKNKLILELSAKQNDISEVVFYGFSFSPNDQEYVQTIFMCLPSWETKYKLYYFVNKDESDETVIDRYHENMIKCACDIDRIKMIKCNGIGKF